MYNSELLDIDGVVGTVTGNCQEEGPIETERSQSHTPAVAIPSITSKTHQGDSVMTLGEGIDLT